jgi:hypothetical protein
MSLPENELRVRFRLVQAQARSVAPCLYLQYQRSERTPKSRPSLRSQMSLAEGNRISPLHADQAPHLYLDTLHVPALCALCWAFDLLAALKPQPFPFAFFTGREY